MTQYSLKDYHLMPPLTVMEYIGDCRSECKTSEIGTLMSDFFKLNIIALSGTYLKIKRNVYKVMLMKVSGLQI